MTLTFDEIARERNREQVRAEALAYTEMLREALIGALLRAPDGTEPGEAARESLAQFEAAMEAAIPRWAAGSLTLSPATALAKCKAMRDRIEKKLEEAGEELPELSTTPTKKGAAMPTTNYYSTFRNKAEVLEEANRLAEELRKKDPSLTLAQARSKVWEQNPDLARTYKELPAKLPQRRTPVRKGESVLRRIQAEAQELRKADPALTSAAAKTRAWELNPDLVEAYRREIG